MAKARQQTWQETKTQAGLCPRCGNERRDFNARTGRPYYYGPVCRARANAETAARMKRRRAKGKG